MSIIDLYSKRQKRLRGEIPDVYTYDKIPQSLRVQIVHIIRDCIGYSRSNYYNLDYQAYDFIFKTLCREYGKFKLIEDVNDIPAEQVFNLILRTKINEEVLDVVELSFRYIEESIKQNYFNYTQQTKVNIEPDEAIKELNERFKEHGIGYSFDGGKLIRIDSTYIHSEITKPTISLLWNSKFKGANEEYLKAHEHYRNGRNKECLTECLKAFESTIKIICTEKKWSFDQNDAAKKLIQICLNKDLVPSFSQNQFTSLQSLLESGIPTIRNKLGGHGQGQVPQKVSDEITRYG